MAGAVIVTVVLSSPTCLLDRGIELMRQGLDDARAKADMRGLAACILRRRRGTPVRVFLLLAQSRL